jgi:hypothetical protein
MLSFLGEADMRAEPTSQVQKIAFLQHMTQSGLERSDIRQTTVSSHNPMTGSKIDNPQKLISLIWL